MLPAWAKPGGRFSRSQGRRAGRPTASVSQRAYGPSVRSTCASRFCWSFHRDGRRRRALSSRLRSSYGSLADRATASTSGIPAPPRCPRRRARAGVAARRPERRHCRRRGSRPRAAGRVDRTRARGRTARGPGRSRPRRRRRPWAGTAGRLPLVRALPPPGRVRSERRLRRGGVLVLAWLLGISRFVAEIGALAGDRGVRPGGRLAAVGRSRRGRGRAGVTRVARRAAAGPLVFPPARSRAPPRVEPVQPLRARVPTLVRGGRGDLRRSFRGSKASSRGIPCRSGSARSSRSREHAGP